MGELSLGLADAVCELRLSAWPAPFAGDDCMNNGDGTEFVGLFACWRPWGVPDGRAGVEDCDFREEWPRLRDEAGDDILRTDHPQTVATMLD